VEPTHVLVPDLLPVVSDRLQEFVQTDEGRTLFARWRGLQAKAEAAVAVLDTAYAIFNPHCGCSYCAAIDADIPRANADV
jgi:hypothetical protein